MNELSKLFLSVNDGNEITLKKDFVYHVRQDDSFEFRGYYCSNTAQKHENPDGMRKCAVYLKGKKNVIINGNGATVLVHGKMTPLMFDECENVTVKNLTIDYACPTMAEFTVVSNDNGKCIIKINPECLFKVKDNDLIWHGENGADGNPYWEDSYIGNRRYIKVFNPETGFSSDFRRDNLEFEKITQLSANELEVTLKNKDISVPVGSVVQTRNVVRDQTGSMFQRCKNLRFENMRIKFMHGLGMVSQFCENVEFFNCDLTPADGRTIASTADFFQFSGCKGKLIIDSCKASGAQDDYVNVHGTHLQIVDCFLDKNQITVRFMHNESWGFRAFEKGDEIEFIKWNTLVPYASAKVVDYVRLNDTDIQLTLDSALPEIELCKDVVENATYTPDLYVRNCDFGPTSGRGILCTTRGEVIIENNRFRKLWGPALLVEDDCNFWFESGYTNEIIFRNNRVISCEYASTYEGSPVIRYSPKVMDETSEQFVHGKLTLTGNSFELPVYGVHRIRLEYLKEAVIEDNVFDAPYEIDAFKSGSITDRNNKTV